MQAIVLIGGFGTRLHPLTFSTPKSLLPIANSVFLERLFHWFESNEITEVILALSHLSVPIIEFLKTISEDTGITVNVRLEEKPLGSAGAVKNCADLLKDDFILFNGDILTDLNLLDLIAFHTHKKATITATLSKVENPTHYGIAELDETSCILDWQEKPSPQEAKSEWGNVGAWVASLELLDYIPEDRFVSLEKDIFPVLIKKEVPFFGYRFSGYWKDIGTIGKYVQANRDLLYGKIKGRQIPGREVQKGIWIAESATIAENVVLEPPLIIGENCRISSGTSILGPSVVGDNCIVGREARISSTIMWPSSQIGDHTTVNNSIIASADIADNCVIPEHCVISNNSILGKGTLLKPNTVFGPGSVFR
jgi:mannose-1-phosphate guanylyltransferase/phosphomannomutase